MQLMALSLPKKSNLNSTKAKDQTWVREIMVRHLWQLISDEVSSKQNL